MAFTSDSDIAFLLIELMLMGIYLCWIWFIRKKDQTCEAIFQRSQRFYLIHILLGIWPLISIVYFIVFYKGHSSMILAATTLFESVFFALLAVVNSRAEIKYSRTIKQNATENTTRLIYLGALSGTAINLSVLRILQLKKIAPLYFITNMVGFVFFILGSFFLSYFISLAIAYILLRMIYSNKK